MGSETTTHVREAVYHGVEPYPKGHEGFAAYVPWTQAHQRDFGQADFQSLLTAAQDWLKTPVLSVAIDGIVRDMQLRAALDLAIRTHGDGRYSAGVDPPTYNKLLAQLAGEEGGTLLTVQANSVTATSPYAHEEKNEETPMSLSVKLSNYASKIASTHPEIAYDLVAFAREAGEMPPQFRENAEKKKEEAEAKKEEGEKKQAAQQEVVQQATEEQQKQASAYAQIRSSVIRTAAADPLVREALKPVLQLIKQIG
jgi:hypothetical protein